jgi:hypothetical protein
MSIHYHLPIDADIIAGLRIRATGQTADNHVPIAVDPCGIGARFTVNDEDGSLLINFEMEQLQ